MKFSTCSCLFAMTLLSGPLLTAQETAVQSGPEAAIETPTDVDSSTPTADASSSGIDEPPVTETSPDDATNSAESTPAGKIDLRTADEAVRSRYRNINGEWWYQMKSGRWVYWRDGKWQDFDPAEYTPPNGAVPLASQQGAVINQWSSMPPIQNVVPQTSGGSLVPYSVVPRTYVDELDRYRNLSPSRSVYGPGVPYGAYRPLYNSPAELRRFGGIEYGTRTFGVGGLRPFGGLPSYSGLGSSGPGSTGFGSAGTRSYSGGFGGGMSGGLAPVGPGNRRGGQ